MLHPRSSYGVVAPRPHAGGTATQMAYPMSPAFFAAAYR